MGEPHRGDPGARHFTGMRSLPALIILCAGLPAAGASSRVISLAGRWSFRRGGPELALHPGPLPQLTFAEDIVLPGTTDTQRKGPASSERSTYALTQPWHFEGVCWYQREVTIPADWRGRRVTLFLERTKYTQLWLDGRPIGDKAIFLTPQEYELGHDLTPGRHTITLAVDNRRLPPFGVDAHQFSANTQGNWNGILGKIELRMTGLAWIDDAQVYPDSVRRRIEVKLRIENLNPSPIRGSLRIDVRGKGIAPGTARAVADSFSPGESRISLGLPLGPGAALWDEFHPMLDHLTVRLKAAGSEDERRITFGLRNFTVSGHRFRINGRPVFLRGRHDACVFPLTGHPPMDLAGWLKYFRICKSYGLNHIRFHTWVPPEAAFEAADRLGFYLQPELPFWGAFDLHDKKVWEPEAKRLLSQFGNHPSFVMFSLGNEPWGGAGVLASLVADLRASDPRVLYIRGTNGFSGKSRPGNGDDYYIGADLQPDANGPKYQIRGANAGDHPGHVQAGPPNTMADYADAISRADYPVISHEMGQYSVFPDFRQIAKYTGVTRAYNLEHGERKLIGAGMADEDQAFAKASGALAALCYREEIESCLRTPDYGGFELLDLMDYPGQGTALVGMLDAFMDSKGIITPGRWRQFCAPMVLLARFPKYTWTQGETFAAEVELAQYGERDLSHAVLAWSLVSAKGLTLVSGELPPVNVARGNVRPVGDLTIPLGGLPAPSQLRLRLKLLHTAVATSYPLWVYPPKADITPPAHVTLVRRFGVAAEKALAEGRRVLLVCDGSEPLARTVGGGFAPDFWSFRFFHNKPGTLGLLCDPASPALAQFPTESHSDWEWFPIALNAQPLILDTITPPADRPIVQVIANDVRDHKLGLVFEVKSGRGRLLVCAADLVSLGAAHPEARQLLASLLAYAGSDRFHPRSEVSAAALRGLFRVAIPMTGCLASASSFDPGWQGYSPSQLIDGNESRGWRADPKAAGRAWCQVKFPRSVNLGACELLWDRPGYRYLVQSSENGAKWTVVSDRRKNAFTAARQMIPLNVRAVRYVRVVITAAPRGHPAAIDEIRFYAHSAAGE